MDSKVKDAKIMPIASDLEHQKEAVTEILSHEKGSESESLLAPGLCVTSKEFSKTRKKVHWKDTYGNDLAVVLEFQPSDASDSDEDDTDSCLCTIM